MPASSPLNLAAAVIRHSREAIVSHGFDGLISSWNPAAERMFGYAAAEAIGRNLLMLVPAEQLAEQARIDAVVAGGEAVEAIETVRQRRDGSKISVAVSATPIFDEQGKPLGAATVMRDINNRKQLEARLRFFESVVSSSSDAIITRDRAGLITSWNRAAE